MPTKTVSCNEDAWQPCDILGSTGVLVQMANRGTVRVHMGSEAPSVDTLTGVVLGEGLEEIGIRNIPVGEDLWIRASGSMIAKITLLYG